MNWALLQNSLLVGGLASLLALGFGLVAAVFTAGLGPRARQGALALAVAALALPPFLVTNCWIHLLGQSGVWRGWLPLSIYSLGGTAWVLALLLWPVSMFLFLAAWSRIPANQIESEPALTGWSLLRWSLLPAARTELFQATLITLVLALGNFAVPAILQVKVFPAELWVRFSTEFDYLGAAWLSVPLILPPLLLVIGFARRPPTWPHRDGALPAALFRRRLGIGWLAAGAGAALIGLAAVALPVTDLLQTQRAWTELPGAMAAGSAAIVASVRFAVVTATLTVAFGLVTWRWRWGSALWMLWLMPGVFLGIALIFLLNRGPFIAIYQSSAVVFLALLLRYGALGWQGASQARHTVDPDLDDVARLGGASPGQRFRLVHWPQMAPLLAATWYVVYLLSLWDAETVLLIVPPGGETLALRIFNLLHYGHNAQVDALCLVLLALALAPLGLWRFARFAGAGRRARSRSWPLVSGACAAGWGRWSGAWAAAFGLGLLTGCSPSATQAELKSEFFSRVEVWGTRGAGPGQFNKPRSIAVDRKDNVYVVDMTGRVQKFSPRGEFLRAWQMPQTDLGKPKGMALDREGRIVVIEPHYSRVNHFSVDGELGQQWGSHGTNAGTLAFPRAVAVNSRGELLVSEYGVVERVQRFSPDGRRLLGVTGQYGSAPGEFNRPEGLGLDARDRMYVADSCNHRIQVFTEEGRWLATFGRAGSGRGELSYPYDVRVDAEGHRFVCEFGNSRIQVFDAQNQPREIIGGVGARPGEFNNPWSIALDSQGNLYVADAGNHRVQKLVRRRSVASG